MKKLIVPKYVSNSAVFACFSAAEAEKLRKELKRAMQAKNEAKEKLTNVSIVKQIILQTICLILSLYLFQAGSNTSADMGYPPYTVSMHDPPALASTPLPHNSAIGDSIMVTGASVSPLQIQPLSSNTGHLPATNILHGGPIISHGHIGSNGSIQPANGGLGSNGTSHGSNGGLQSMGSNGGSITGQEHDETSGNFARVSEMQHLSQEIEKER